MKRLRFFESGAASQGSRWPHWAGLALFLVLAALFSGCRKQVEEKKQKQLQALKDVLVPMRFQVIERSNGRIKAEFRFYAFAEGDIDSVDLEFAFENMQPIGSTVVELEGEELFIDCLRLKEKQGFFKEDVNWVFPYRLFTDAIPPDQGTPIYGFYDQGGFPAIYGDSNDPSSSAGSADSSALSAEEQKRMEEEYKNHLEEIFAQIKQYGDIPNDSPLRKTISGSAVHDLSNIGSQRFRLGRWYALITHIVKGGVEFKME